MKTLRLTTGTEEEFRQQVLNIAMTKKLRPVFAAGVGYMLQNPKGYTDLVIIRNKP